MNGNFSFIEYSYPAGLLEVMTEKLQRLGFTWCTKHRTHPMSLWIQNRCIMLLRESDKNHGISGIGYVEPSANINKLPVQFDPLTDMFAMQTNDGFNHYFVSENEIEYTGSIGFNFEPVEQVVQQDSGFEYFSGLLTPEKYYNDYYHIGYENGKQVDNYSSLITKNKRFHLLVRQGDTNARPCLVIDTADIFATTAFLTWQGFETKTFNTDRSKLDLSDKLSYRVAAYDCVAYGTNKSYTIENFFVEPLPNVDVIIRQRKNTLSVGEQSIRQYYE